MHEQSPESNQAHFGQVYADKLQNERSSFLASFNYIHANLRCWALPAK